jgi:hypothetical protein
MQAMASKIHENHINQRLRRMEMQESQEKVVKLRGGSRRFECCISSGRHEDADDEGS